jgi:hypothetical protein
MTLSEDALCGAFANKLVESPAFVAWLLRRTKFKQYAQSARLLHEEQSIRPAKHWWRHWWCKVPELNAESETDIFLVFECIDTKLRFSLHVECKLANGKFMARQPEAYSFRGRHMSGKPKYLNYKDFETMLIAPESFRALYRMDCDLFDRYLSFKDLSEFVPEFSAVN